MSKLKLIMFIYAPYHLLLILIEILGFHSSKAYNDDIYHQASAENHVPP